MSGSLRDQLMGLGFKPAPKAKPETRRESRPDSRPDSRQGNPRSGRDAGARRDRSPADTRHSAAHKSRTEMDLGKAYAIRAQKEKEERIAQEKARQEEAQRKREGKQKLAELLKTATLNEPTADVARHFEYGGKIRRIYVTPEQLKALNAGELGVVQQGGRYHLVAAEHALAANDLMPGVLALLVDPAAAPEDDAYADPRYQVPDDLVW
jgi:uncharacterized protein YaiL (DUF2058 family)